MQKIEDMEDFLVKVNYSTVKDAIKIESDRSLTKGDVILILGTFLMCLDKEEREKAISVALAAINQKEQMSLN